MISTETKFISEKVDDTMDNLRQELIHKAAVKYMKDGISPDKAVKKAKVELEKSNNKLYNGIDISILDLFEEISRIKKNILRTN